jgi:hypothetical protein
MSALVSGASSVAVPLRWRALHVSKQGDDDYACGRRQGQAHEDPRRWSRYLHDQAWDVADKIVLAMRKGAK